MIIRNDALRLITWVAPLRDGIPTPANGSRCRPTVTLLRSLIKVKRGKLELPLSVEDLAQRIERSGVVELLPVDTKTWLRSAALEWDHRDPADRVIVATALEKGLPLLTKDAVLHAFRPAICVW